MLCEHDQLKGDIWGGTIYVLVCGSELDSPRIRCMSLSDFAKAFNCVKHKESFNMLCQIGTDGKE